MTSPSALTECDSPDQYPHGMPAYMTGGHHETEIHDDDDEDDDDGSEKKVTMTIESTNIRNTG